MTPSHPQPESEDRRAFFRHLGRLAALGALGLFSGSLLIRRRVQLPGPGCTNDGICRTCNTFDGCNLPSALYTRRAIQQGKLNPKTGGLNRG